MDQTHPSEEQLAAEVRALRARLSECRQAEEALRQELHLLHAVTEGNQEAVFVKDCQGRYLMINSAGARLIGRTVQEVIGQDDRQLFAPDSARRLIETDRRIMASGETLPHEQVATAAGVTRHYLVTKSPYRDPQGRIAGVLGVARDITERQRLEALWHQSEERLRHVLEGSRDGVYQLNLLTGTYDYVSPAVEQISGYPAEELIAGGLGLVTARTHPDDLERLREHVNRLLAHTVEEHLDPTIEYRFHTKHRGYRWISDSRAVLFDQGHVAVAIIGNVRDVTERKQAEEERARLIREQAARGQAEEAQRRYHDLVQGLDAIVCEADARTWQFTFVSRRAETILGYAVERWLAEPDFWVHLIHPGDRERVVAWCRSATAEGRDYECEYRAVAADGRVVWLRDQVRVCADGGEVRQLRCLMTDITERRRAEEQARESAQRLQTLSRRLLEVQESERRFLTRELHDEIGQLLTGLKLLLETSLRAPAAARGPLGEAQALVHDLAARVRNLSLCLRPTMLDDLGLLPALLWHVDRYTAQTHVWVNFHHTGLDRRFAPEVETAAYRIVQEALTNVARHAGVQQVTVGLWADQDRLMVQVEDRGTGFDADAALAAQNSSGLAGMRERAMLLSGELRVESAAGSGTCVTAELPLDGQSQRPGTPEESRQAERSGDHAEDGR